MGKPMVIVVIFNLPSTAYEYYTPTSALPAPTVVEYDEKDRQVKVTQPGETNFASFEYSIVEGMMRTQVTNENSQYSVSFKDVRGRQRKTVQMGVITTEFDYNPVNELIRVTNTNGYETTYAYDLAGRRTKEFHPDRGLTKFTYNRVGNITKKVTANLMQQESTGEIEYDYDYHRLTHITYPNNPENNVEYTYGDDTNANINGIGRLIQQEDATGIQWFEYGNLGELTLNGRAIAVAGKMSYWFVTEWEYDSWNRIRKITYPDTEEVTYNYDGAGQLESITNDIPGSFDPEDVVSEIIYNEYGERASITYGNNTITTYDYDTRRRLKTLTHIFGSSNNTFTIGKKYDYDLLSNINTITTSSSLPGTGQLIGPAAHEYFYDDYNRLTEANGYYVGSNDVPGDFLRQEYSLTMEYDEAHNITSKLQNHMLIDFTC